MRGELGPKILASSNSLFSFVCFGSVSQGAVRFPARPWKEIRWEVVRIGILSALSKMP